MTRIATGFGAVVVLGTAIASAAADLPDLGPTDRLEVERGRVTLELVEPTPAAGLLQEIGRRAGFAVEVRGAAGNVERLSIRDRPLAEALLSIAGRHSLILGYEGGRERLVYALLLGNRSDAPITTKIERPRPERPVGDDRLSRSTALRDIVKLSYRSDAGAVDALGKVVTTADQAALRAAAISALAGIGGERAAELVGTKGLTDRDPKVREQAVSALWRLQGEGARTRLMAMASLEQNPSVQAAVRHHLAPSGSGRNTQK